MTVDQQPGEPASPAAEPVVRRPSARDGPPSTRCSPPTPGGCASRASGTRGVLVVIIAAVVSWVAVVMSHSEIAHAHLHSATAPAPSIASAPPSATQQLAWSNGDRLALGEPFWSGTVVTFAGHTVTGRNARTGAATWTYTRTDMPICEVAETQGQTIALFNREGNCDEIDAFDTEHRPAFVVAHPRLRQPDHQRGSRRGDLAVHAAAHVAQPGARHRSFGLVLGDRPLEHQRPGRLHGRPVRARHERCADHAEVPGRRLPAAARRLRRGQGQQQPEPEAAAVAGQAARRRGARSRPMSSSRPTNPRPAT